MVRKLSMSGWEITVYDDGGMFVDFGHPTNGVVLDFAELEKLYRAAVEAKAA